MSWVTFSSLRNLGLIKHTCLIRPRFLKLENVTQVVDDNNSALAGYVGVGVIGLDVDVNVEFV